jgi:hypothetical protein
VDDVEDASPSPHSSLPGSTRQSILFEKILVKMMDTRVKPAYDAEYVVVIASEAKQSGRLPKKSGLLRCKRSSQ